MKNLNVKAKLIVGFGVVIVMSIILTVFALIALETTATTYRNKLNYSQQRVQIVLGVRYDTMDLRRITTAIRADCGNEERQQGHAASSDNLVASINESLNRYVELVRGDTALTAEKINELVQVAETKRATTAQYKRDLIDPNIAFGMVDDRESLSANSAAQASLIADFNTGTDEMVEFEKELADVLIEGANSQATFLRTLLIIIALIIALASVSLALSIANLISKPVKVMSAFMRKAGATGNISTTAEEERTWAKYYEVKDEIGQMMKDFDALISHVVKISNELQTIANGDLAVDIQLLSGTDTMGQSLKNLVDNLNSMFGEVNLSTEQVSSGAKQIANGSQTLAQGSTEQAASVQQLSASIADILQKTKDNAQLADRAATLADTIKNSAETGSRQMDEMMTAVEEINTASQSIGKVIKTIDDIAFQTNILALNAAVEAARAGQHGKGFAVVAEEVRNLASKSAEAAKDTGVLIQNSIEKAELGARIAGETSSSLTEIVSGINESSALIGDIARSSEEQSLGITQINTGIDQVAQVVQQNSATAEESAAASEEMSSQAGMLEELISQFKLKGGSRRSLPAAEKPAQKQLSMPEKSGGGDFGKY